MKQDHLSGAGTSGSTPTLTPFVLLGLLHLVTMAPAVSPSAVYRPQIGGFFLSGDFYRLGTAVAGSCLFLGAIRAAHYLTHRSRRSFVPLVSGFLILPYLLLLGAVAFFTKFGAYPSPRIVLDLVAAPSVFVAYTRSGASLWDTTILVLAAAIVVGMVIAATRRVWQEPVNWRRPAWNILFGIAFLWLLREFPPRTIDREHAFMFRERSLPVAKYALEALTVFDSNRIEHARPLIPRPSGVSEPAAIPKARHIVLILAECLRADHLPAYGYERETTPFIQSDAGKWLVFKRAYAHGSRTADSFPVIFNSQYFAGIDRGNEGAQAVWRTLREAGVGSAFLSAGAMEWGGVTHALDFQDIDHRFMASDVDPVEQRNAASLPSDYAVDDVIPLRRYINLLEKELSARPSFAALHFVGSHYPFQYEDTADRFLPTIRQGPADMGEAAEAASPVQAYATRANLTASWLEHVANSYDNSIVHIDGLVRQIVEGLERLGIADDSVVIFTSDHGESLGEHQTLFHGTTLYEEQVHVPMLIRVGAHLEPVRSLLEPALENVVGQVDLMPTILHLLTGDARSVKPLEGMSWLAGSRKPYELLLFRGIGERVAIVTGDRKYLFDLPGRRAEAYSLRNDPKERQNLWTGEERTIDQFIASLASRGGRP